MCSRMFYGVLRSPGVETTPKNAEKSDLHTGTHANTPNTKNNQKIKIIKNKKNVLFENFLTFPFFIVS